MRRLLSHGIPGILAAALLLPGLGASALWQDEAETAVLAVRVLETGLPRAFDGVNLVAQTDRSFDRDYVWTYHPWLPMYLAAGGIALLGRDSIGARLPFALLGVLAVLLFHAVLRRRLPGGRGALPGALLLALSVPFLLHARECRYYAPGILFTILAFEATLRAREGTRGGGQLLALALLLLFHSSTGYFAAVLAGILAHAFLDRRELRGRGGALRWIVLALVLVAPALLLLRVWERTDLLLPVRGVTGGDGHLRPLFRVARVVNDWIFPGVLLAVPAALLAGRRGDPGVRTRLTAPAATLAASIALAVVLLAAATRGPFFRYLLPALPAILFLLALVLGEASRWSRDLALFLFLLVAGTNLASLPLDLLAGAPARARSPLVEYAASLGRRARGPNEAAIEHLNAHADPGDTILVNYEDLPLVYHTRLVVRGGLTNFGLDGIGTPEWVLVRRSVAGFEPYAAVLASGAYEAIPLRAPDVVWGNLPDPDLHAFTPAPPVPELLLHRRRSTPTPGNRTR
jgi:hypothetical protein